MIQVVVKPGFQKTEEGSKTDASIRSTPLANVHTSGEGWLIRLAVPGISKDALQIRLEANKLVVEGKYPEATEKEIRTLHREFGTGTMSRSFLLPELAAPQGIQAKYEAGILEIHIPRRPATVVQVL